MTSIVEAVLGKRMFSCCGLKLLTSIWRPKPVMINTKNIIYPFVPIVIIVPTTLHCSTAAIRLRSLENTTSLQYFEFKCNASA